LTRVVEASDVGSGEERKVMNNFVGMEKEALCLLLGFSKILILISTKYPPPSIFG
jgi:hypothetical protein